MAGGARDLRELEISIRKSELSQQESDAVFNLQLYVSLVKRNRQSLGTHLFARETDIDRGFLEYLQEHTRMNGALDIRKILANPSHSSFLDNPDRLSRSGKYSRGYTYLVSRDIGLTAAEKLSIYKADLLEALECMKNFTSRLEIFVISDYVKNAMITMLNALVSEEKIGLFNLDDEEYQSVRLELIDLSSLATRFHYQFFFRNRRFALPDNYTDRARRAVSYLERKSAKRWSRLHAASLSRPEASHPVVMFCASLKIASAHPNVQTLIGLPSGGTELALLIDMHYDFLYGCTPRNIFLPVSLHSVKDIYGERGINNTGIASFLGQYRCDLLGRNVLICDDNSSTGRTLQYTYNAIRPLVGYGGVQCVVAEVDIIRSLLDRRHTSREYVANPALFEQAINILPISKRRYPKTDIKELMERQEIIHHHKRQHSKAADEAEAIYREVMIDTARQNMAKVIEVTPRGSLVDSLQGTALSNFYAIPILYQGITYPSVEHAYQHQKFTSGMLDAVDDDTLDEIREAMRLRGFGAPIQHLNALFTDDRFNAGNVKIIADILRKRDYGKKQWADQRVKTMISLLLVKFADARMRALLLATKDQIIIEGNDWDDTLWGYCGGRGRNLLGRILMNIRDRKKSLSVTDKLQV